MRWSEVIKPKWSGGLGLGLGNKIWGFIDHVVEVWGGEGGALEEGHFRVWRGQVGLMALTWPKIL